jgi:hypothetical protein
VGGLAKRPLILCHLLSLCNAELLVVVPSVDLSLFLLVLPSALKVVNPTTILFIDLAFAAMPL